MPATFQLPSVRPDAIFAPQVSTTPGTDLTNVCPVCGSAPHEAPEGVYGQDRAIPYHVRNADGSAKYNFGDAVWEAQHCWKCGFRPGTNSEVWDEIQARKAFNKWLAEQTADSLNHPTQQGVATLTDDQLTSVAQQLAEKLGLSVPNQASVTEKG